MSEVELNNQELEQQEQSHEETVPKRVINPERTIFIGNVAHEVTTQDLKQIFQGEFGDDIEVEIPEKEPRQKPNGHTPQSKHALVIFPNDIDYDAIKSKYDLTVLNEREIHIKRAKTSDELRAIAERRHFGGYRGGYRGGFRGGRGGFRGGRGGFRGGRGGFRGGRGGARGGFHQREKVPLEQLERSKDTLYVNNVPFHITKEELANFFSTTAENIVLPMRRSRNFRTGRVYQSDTLNRGIAFVTFEGLADETEGISKKVEEFNGKTLDDRTLTVDIAAEKPPKEEEQDEQEEEEEQNENEDVEAAVEKEEE